ncbi:MAG: rod shape-determining protein RodA [Bacteroidetes bacterium]|nr:rod shape-determining protein RodA [Bacteroidota bacterium]
MRGQKFVLTNIDWVLVALYLLLVIMGWFNIYAASYNETHTKIFDFSQKYGKQMIWIIAAFTLALLVLMIDGKFFSQFAYLFYGISILLLIAVIFSGREISGSKSWFQIAGVALQPVEFAKVGVCLAIAKYLSALDVNMRQLKTQLVMAACILFPAVLVIFQHDTGSAIVFLSLVLVLYRAGLSGTLMTILVIVPLVAILSLVINKYIIIGVLLVVAVLFYLNSRRRLRNILGIAGLYLASVAFVFSVNFGFNHILEPHQRSRINVLLGNDTDLKGAGYNVNQSLIAIGSGEIFGKGYLKGTQTKYNFVPEQSTDFIFCTIGEEWGFAGSFVVIALFMWLFIRIIIVAERQRSKFSRLFGYGTASLLFFHFFINIGMALGLLPVIGIPLPFFSYGGSSLWAFTLLLFIFIRQDSYRYELL